MIDKLLLTANPTFSTEHLKLAFQHFDTNGRRCESTFAALPNLKVGYEAFQVHTVFLEHPTGKVWESLFIAGATVTWWARRPGANGSCNFKHASLIEWYNQIASKIQRGYEILHLSGLANPLNYKHKFIKQAIADGVHLPYISVNAESYSDIELANGLAVHGPTATFMKNLAERGHKCHKLIAGDTIGEKVVRALEVTLQSPSSDQSLHPPIKEPTPIVTHQERYGAMWGAFG